MHQWKQGDLGQVRPQGELDRIAPSVCAKDHGQSTYMPGSVLRYCSETNNQLVADWDLIMGSVRQGSELYCDDPDTSCVEYVAFVRPIKELPND